VGAHGGKVDERHVGVCREQLALPGPLYGGGGKCGEQTLAGWQSRARSNKSHERSRRMKEGRITASW
jgi:hypothetical protein